MAQNKIIGKYHKYGISSFSDSELLSSLGINLVTDLDLGSLISDSFENLIKLTNIGDITAIKLMAINEIFDRKIRYAKHYNESISSSNDAFNIIKKLYAGIKVEQFWCLFLNRRNKIISKELLSFGSDCSTIIPIKIVCKRAVELCCSSIIISHNHPSLSITPSGFDIESTKNLSTGLKLLDITLLDHIIYGTAESYYSFADEGAL